MIGYLTLLDRGVLCLGSAHNEHRLTGMIILFNSVPHLVSLASLVFMSLIETPETGRMDTFQPIIIRE